MLYSRLTLCYESIGATSKRLEITALLVELLRETPSSIIDKVVYLTQGKLYPDYLGIEVGIADKLTIKSLATVTGVSENKITTQYKAKGDLGTATEELLAKRPQTTL